MARRPKASRTKRAKPARRQDTSTRRIERLLARLDEAYPDAKCALDFTNPLELLIATILSAQSTDKMVNTVTPALFARYRTARDLAGADRTELERMIHSTGFFRNKAKHIQEASRIITGIFGGNVPATMEELLTLPGVARKTANVVLGVAFEKAEGVVVDTHVQRLAGRLELSRESNPEKIEQDLMRIIPKDRWIAIGHLLIHHGRRICDARKPKCDVCPVEDLCKSPDKQLS